MFDMFTFVEECEIELLASIEKYLNELPSEDIPKLYFSGEFDSNQTKFEYGSNNLELGVLSSNKTVALVLLRFLRIIIDDRPEFLIEDIFHSWVEEFDPKDNCIDEKFKMIEKLEISEIIKKLSEKEEDYMECFPLGQEISTNFIKEECNFIRNPDDIDIWTFQRIMKEIRDLY